MKTLNILFFYKVFRLQMLSYWQSTKWLLEKSEKLSVLENFPDFFNLKSVFFEVLFAVICDYF